PLFVVDDALRGLERLGVAARARSGAGILAITGSVGKTSAKEMARLALSAVGTTHASVASFNNHWGVPLTLARLPAEAAFGVFEIGMNHPGEITPLVGLVRPQVALVTAIGAVHIEYFGSLEAIADAKAEIFSGVAAGGAAILNRDAPQFERLAAAARGRGLRIVDFGAKGAARLIACEPQGEGSRITAEIDGEPIEFALGAAGRHMAENAIGVLAAIKALGAPLARCAAALAAFAPAKGRGERFTLSAPAGPFTLIDESYNANPVSMRAALALLGAAKPGPGGRRIAVIGDMLELGADGAALHAGLAADLEANQVDLLFGAGALTRALYEAAPAATRGAHAERAEALRAPLVAALRAGDVVMIKGSNGSRMGPLTAALREHFSPGDCGAGRSTC
ncbi:MAG TPA: UDP-N-acetylmuramoyl-tripeptide--D-alanyl-D-alanine ligase, partial [Roseiarcus sp.]|nr:UDP-N-acetylmuramoyl-tripeptide--D-alanyl-D-alanine ligase [Roseiarcus sp.]